MTQIHKRFTVDQVSVLFRAYGQGTLDRAAVEEILGIGKTRFFALLKLYREVAPGSVPVSPIVRQTTLRYLDPPKTVISDANGV